uniref:Uncharacterized protein n=1 Tax=viral metagenome TaxID=1070528 RepID=A0A6M3Y876_9ZZZZ
MNNSKIIEGNILKEEPAVDLKPMLRQRQEETVSIIEALQAVKGSEYWKVLQDKVFQGSLEVLERRIRTEKEPQELYRLQGQLGWAEKFTNLDKLVELYRKELDNIKNQIKNG